MYHSAWITQVKVAPVKNRRYFFPDVPVKNSLRSVLDAPVRKENAPILYAPLSPQGVHSDWIRVLGCSGSRSVVTPLLVADHVGFGEVFKNYVLLISAWGCEINKWWKDRNVLSRLWWGIWDGKSVNIPCSWYFKTLWYRGLCCWNSRQPAHCVIL